jgi:nucleotide-binding universal stress UspA family protein
MRLETSRLRRVLCALDVERSGSTPLTMASLLAERFHASVDALYASSPVVPFPNRADRVKRLITDHNAQERLSGIVASMTRKVCVSSYVTRGPASTVILTHSERHRSDLIVMASSPPRRFAGPPNTIAPVAAHAPCAVLTVGDRFHAVPLRRILLPIAPGGAEQHALSWVTALASRFDAEVGLLRIDQPRSGFWKTFATAPQARPATLETTGAGCAEVLVALQRSRIDAYDIEHPGGSDSDALSELCNSGAFDAIVMGLPAAGEGKDGADALVASVRLKSNAPVLSVRAIRSPVLFAPGRSDLLPKAVVGADWAQP